MSYKSLENSKDVVFENEPVEYDGSTSKMRKGKKGSIKPTVKQPTKIQSGRIIMAKGRESKKIKIKTMPDAETAKRAPGRLETVLESQKLLKSTKFKGGIINHADGGPGLQSALQATQHPTTKTRHNLEEYTPLQKIPKKDLDKPHKKLLDAMVRKNTAKEFVHYYQIVGGDEGCESHFGKIKNTERRLGTRVGPSTDSHIDAMSSHYLLQKPGFRSAIAAMVAYRKFCLSKDPDESFDSTINEWLYD